ncbi:nuclear pore complex protein Nup205-like [Saccostrea cucullata]|uniref:nuclear pore complex protein Nup205-like n=1 Tax=Saccostrea cuccullata TaxID=36930 RepID=UPI002ED04AED
MVTFPVFSAQGLAVSITINGLTSQFSQVLFQPSLDEAIVRDLGSTDDTSFLRSSTCTVQALSLGVVVYQLCQCANHFMSVYESHKQHLRKLQSLADLSTDDLKQFSGVEEKLASHQRLAKTSLTKIVHYKEEQLQYFAYILENCLFMLWRHLEYYLIHCVPVNQQTSSYPSQTRRHTQLRRLQDLTGICESDADSLSDIDRQLMMGVTSDTETDSKLCHT